MVRSRGSGRRGNRSQPRSRSTPLSATPIDITVEKLGSEGLGVARVKGAAVLIADALLGEQFRILAVPAPAHSQIVQRLSTSDKRVIPPCPHFSLCGGCALQHLASPLYKDFKRDLVIAALRRERLDDIEILPVIVSPPHSRRRATLTILRKPGGVILGFHPKASHEIAPIEVCPVVAPIIEALFEPLRALMAKILNIGEQVGATLSAVDNGVDLGLHLPEPPDLSRLELLLEFANFHDLTRLWWRDRINPPEPMVARRSPIIAFGSVPVQLPMGGFLQATRDGEAALITGVIDGVGSSGRILDLYAGIGTFTLPLAATGKNVHAVESDADAIGALTAAARLARLPVTTEKRDLELRPLRKDELEAFDAVIFDPPRAGAKAQVAIMQEAKIATIVAASCNPSTFARDAAILIQGGWRLDRVQPIDQFLWSPHIELIAVFRR